MALNDVSLTSGMRSNLLSLQNTVTLLNRTQNRLSTGKKVNSAIDNPVSYFAAQSLTSRASTIDSLKDAMGQAVSTINAADKGITSITALIQQAKGIAQSAQSADNTQNTVTETLTALAAGDTVVMGGLTLTATSSSVTAGALEFNIGSTQAETAANMAAKINSLTDGQFTTTRFDASANGAVVTFSEKLIATQREINAAAADVTVSAGATEAVVTAGTSELESLQQQYNTLRIQITALAGDSGYQGKNLLKSDTLNVKFEGATLSVAGFDASASGLGINSVTWATSLASNIDTDINSLDAAMTTLRKQSSTMSGNLSIITTRQDFSNNMINTLTEGSDKLTAADTNEEGANMLMLQTRQSLSTTALSLSAQAAQSVLKLFG